MNYGKEKKYLNLSHIHTVHREVVAIAIGLPLFFPIRELCGVCSESSVVKVTKSPLSVHKSGRICPSFSSTLHLGSVLTLRIVGPHQARSCANDTLF